MVEEVHRLAGWLAALVQGKEEEARRLEFMEAELAFEYIPEEASLQVELRHALHPPGDYEDACEPHVLCLPAEAAELARAAASLRGQLRR